MEHHKIFTVIGGDLRQGCLANLLAEDGWTVNALCLEDCAELSDKVIQSGQLAQTLAQSDVIVFPLPLSTDGVLINAPFSKNPPPVEECMRYISPDCVSLGGMISAPVYQIAKQADVLLCDYYEREELIVHNCIPTAEGALAIAMQETAKTIFGSHCLITGFGRVSKAMAHLLLGCGAKVTVAARKKGDLAWAQMMGAHTVPMAQLSEAVKGCDIIFNTVPVQLLNEAVLTSLKKDCLVIDLASKPGGVDFEAAKQLGIRVVWALSLPGKVAPVTAAQIIRDTVFNMLREEEC